VVPSGLAVAGKPPPLMSQPWIPVSGSIDPLLAGAFVDAPLPPVTPQPVVDSRGGLVSPFGLFPSGSLRSLVICSCVRNKPSFYGVRALIPKELANLWDVPLLAQEYAAGPGSPALLESFLSSVPGKTLLLGSDFLLASFLRGGWCSTG